MRAGRSRPLRRQLKPPEPPRTKDVIPGVFSRHAEAYRDRLMTALGRGEARSRTRLLEVLDARPGQRVLDLGCGPGILTLPLAEAVGPGGLVLGADLAEGMLLLLRSAAPRSVAVARMDMEAPAVRDGSFDAVASGHSLQFCPDLGLALSEVRRALRAEGRFAASVPAGEDPGCARAVLDEVFERRLPAAPEPADSRDTASLVRDEPRLAAALHQAGFLEVAVERIEEVMTYTNAAELVNKSLGWWACARRLEAVPEPERDAVRAEAVYALRDRFGDGQLAVPGASLVASAVR